MVAHASGPPELCVCTALLLRFDEKDCIPIVFGRLLWLSVDHFGLDRCFVLSMVIVLLALRLWCIFGLTLSVREAKRGSCKRTRGTSARDDYPIS